MNKRSLVVLLSSLSLVALLSACGSAPSPGSNAEQAEAEQVEVILTEFGIEAAQTSFEYGKAYEFVITNEGTVAHEFRIIPVVEQGSMEDAHGSETHDTALLAVTEDQLPAGETVTVEYIFPASATHQELEMACHTPGHYEAGMRAPVQVVEAN